MAGRLADKFHQFLERQPYRVLAVATLWLMLEFIGLGSHSYIDSYSLVHYTSIPLALNGGGGYWFPNGIGGLDIKSMQFVFPLANFLYGALPGYIAYQIVVVISIGGASLFTYLLLARRLKLSAGASLLGALSFALFIASHYSTHILDYSLIPALIWALGCLRGMNTIRATAFVVVLTLVYASFSTVVFAVPFVPLAVLTWYTLIELEKRWRFWAFGSLFFILYGLTKVPDGWALLLHLPLSTRTIIPVLNHEAGQAFGDALTIARLVFLPESHIGLVFPLLIVAVVFFKVRDRLVLTSTAIVPATILVLAMTMFLVRSVPTLRESGLNTFSFVRISWVVVFFLSVGLGIAYSAWVSRAGPQSARRVAVLTVAAFAVLFVYSLVPKVTKVAVWYYRGGYATLYEKKSIHELADRVQSQAEPYRMAAYHLYDARFQAYGLETLGGWYSMYPKRWRQFIMEINGFDDDNVKFNNNKEAIFSGKVNHNLLSLANVKYLVTYLPMEMAELELLEEPDAVTSKLNAREKFVFFIKFNFGDAHKFYFYRKPDAFPRFFLTEGVRLFEDSETLLDSLGAASRNDLQRTAFLEWPASREGSPPTSRSGDGKVTLVSKQSDQIELDVDTQDKTFLVVANNYSPFWQARVDGKLTPVYPADHTFWGIEVPAGRHRVEFRYAPPYTKVRFLDLSWWWSRVLS